MEFYNVTIAKVGFQLHTEAAISIRTTEYESSEVTKIH
jgi:hypothetical protein